MVKLGFLPLHRPTRPLLLATLLPRPTIVLLRRTIVRRLRVTARHRRCTVRRVRNSVVLLSSIRQPRRHLPPATVPLLPCIALPALSGAILRRLPTSVALLRRLAPLRIRRLRQSGLPLLRRILLLLLGVVSSRLLWTVMSDYSLQLALPSLMLSILVESGIPVILSTLSRARAKLFCISWVGVGWLSRFSSPSIGVIFRSICCLQKIDWRGPSTNCDCRGLLSLAF